MTIQWKPIENFRKFRLRKVEFIVVHWSGGYTLQSAFDTLKKRGLSYHYMVDGDEIWSLVDEKHVAYHVASIKDAFLNDKTIGVCHIGIWEQPVKEESYATSGQLLAEICKRNGFEPSDKTIRAHKEFKATACPGSLDLNRLIGEARKFYLGHVPEVTPQVTPSPVENLQSVPPPTYPKQVQATETVRVRQESNTQSPIQGLKQKGEIFTVVGETGGETINDNNIWLNTGYGYVTSAYTKDV